MVAVEERIAESLAAGEELTLDVVGGEAVLWQAAGDLTMSRFLPELVHVLDVDWERISAPERAVSFLARSFSEIDHPLTMANTVDSLLASATLLTEVGEGVGPALLGRTERAQRRAQPLVARHALDGAVRLAVGGWMQPFSVLAVLSDLDGGEEPVFATAAARYVGLCYEQFRRTELREALMRLREIPECEADAAFELGMIELVDALERPSPDEIRTGIVAARADFASTTAIEEERQDAEAFGLALDVLIAFMDENPAAQVREKTDQLQSAVWLHRAWLSGMHESWLAPRAAAEVEWYRLASLLADAAGLLEKPSWIEARKALSQVVDAYSATRSVRLFARAEGYDQGLERIIEPRIAASFVREAGLRAHLEDWLEEEAVGEQADEARRLLEQVRGADQKKARSRHSRPPSPT